MSASVRLSGPDAACHTSPQPPHDVGFSLGLEDKTAIDGTTAGALRDRATATKRAYRQRSYVGLTLLLVGFIVQLIDAVS